MKIGCNSEPGIDGTRLVDRSLRVWHSDVNEGIAC